MTSVSAAVLMLLRYLFGGLIGALTASLIYRKHTTTKRVIRAALFAGAAFLFGSGLGGWAGEHASFENGRRMEIAPWGEDLRVRNFIAENDLVICIVLSVSVAAIVNLGSSHQAIR